MDMNNKENIEVLDEFVVDSSSQTNVEPVSVEPTLDSSNAVGVQNVFEPVPMPAVEPVAPVVEPVPMPSVEPASDPVIATVDNGMDLMSDFPTTEPEGSGTVASEQTVEVQVEPVAENVASVEPVVPVVESPSVGVMPEPTVETSVGVTLDSTGVSNNTGINNDQNVTSDYDPTAPVTQASDQQKVKGGKNDTLIFIAILVIVIIVTIFALPFIFNNL